MVVSKSSKWWLIAGALLIGAAHMRWGVGALAWIAPIPFLIYLRATQGAASRAWFALALFAGYTLAILKICTAPIPPIMSLVFALPTTLLMLVAFQAWVLASRRGWTWLAPLVFAAASVWPSSHSIASRHSRHGEL